MKKKISRRQYLKLVGLLAVAQRADDVLTEVWPAVKAIVGDRARLGGHTYDAVFGNTRRDADELLRLLGIEVTA